MIETHLRAKANILIVSLKDEKIINAFQSLLDNATNLEQILMLMDLIEAYQNSTDEPRLFFRKIVFLGQTSISLSDSLLFTLIVNDVAHLFFKSRQLHLKTTDGHQRILKARRDNSFRKF